jgi:hypothetical protein
MLEDTREGLHLLSQGHGLAALELTGYEADQRRLLNDAMRESWSTSKTYEEAKKRRDALRTRTPSLADQADAAEQDKWREAQSKKTQQSNRDNLAKGQSHLSMVPGGSSGSSSDISSRSHVSGAPDESVAESEVEASENTLHLRMAILHIEAAINEIEQVSGDECINVAGMTKAAQTAINTIRSSGKA